MKTNRKMLISKNQKLCTVLDKIDSAMIDSSKMVVTQKDRQIDPAAVKVEDFDCSLCFRLLWQPTTTPCGHTYCRGCIDRSLVSAPLSWCPKLTNHPRTTSASAPCARRAWSATTTPRCRSTSLWSGASGASCRRSTPTGRKYPRRR